MPAWPLTGRNFLGAGLAASSAVPVVAAPPDIRITGFGFLRLTYPEKMPVKRNATIRSGGGQAGMTQLELYTDAGIIGRSLPKSGGLIEDLFDRVQGENPSHVERIWDRMYRGNRKPVAKGDYIIGNALDMPVYKVLGAHTDKLRVYAAGGYYMDDKTTADLVAGMEGYVG